VDLVGPVRDRVRTLLKIRVERGLRSAGVKPGLGARICCEDVRMTVQAGMSDSLWRFLVNQGWREIIFRPDRRRYRDVPTAYVTRLIDSHPEERERVLAAAIANAAYRGRAMRPGTWPTINERR
jgi:hypothetical protein